MEPIEKVLYVSSKSNNTNDSRFRIELKPAIDVDKQRQSVYLSCLHIEFKNSIYNISPSRNNNLLRLLDHASGTWIDLPIRAGIYTVDTIKSGMDADPSHGAIKDQFEFILNPITKRTDILFRNAGSAIDFTDTNLGTLLGFENRRYPEFTDSTPQQVIIAQKVPHVNHVTTAFVHCSLSNKTSSFNGSQCNIVDSIPLGDDEHVSYNPINPIAVDCSNCIGSIVDNIEFWLSDSDNEIISLDGEDWSGKFLVELI